MEGEGLILATKDVVSIPLAREYGNEVIGKSLNVLCSKKLPLPDPQKVLHQSVSCLSWLWGLDL